MVCVCVCVRVVCLNLQLVQRTSSAFSPAEGESYLKVRGGGDAYQCNTPPSLYPISPPCCLPHDHHQLLFLCCLQEVYEGSPESAR